MITKLEDIELSQEKTSENIDYKSYLYNEFEKIDLTNNIQIKIEERLSFLTNTEDFKLFVSEGIQIIEDEKIGLLNQIASLNSLLKKLSDKSLKFENLFSRVSGLSYDLMDVLTELRVSLDHLESNPKELKDLETKLDLIYSLYKKHKVDNVDDLILIKEKLHKEINYFENFEDNIKELKSSINKNEIELNKLSNSIHKNRINAAPLMIKELQLLVSKMGMKSSRFNVNLISILVQIIN